MAYREVTVIEIEEVLRQWIAEVPIKRIARRVGLDPKTVRRYAKAAASCGLVPDQGVAALTAERVTKVVTRLSTAPEREHGDAWALCVEHRELRDERDNRTVSSLVRGASVTRPPKVNSLRIVKDQLASARLIDPPEVFPQRSDAFSSFVRWYPVE